jgi:hypothetical protein
MKLTREAQRFNDKLENFQDLRQRKVNYYWRQQFGVLCLGVLATCLSFFKPHFENISFESSTVSIAIGTLERISIFFSISLATCCAFFFSSILESVPLEFHILGLSFENIMGDLENDKFDERHFHDFMRKFKIHVQQHQKLLE